MGANVFANEPCKKSGVLWGQSSAGPSTIHWRNLNRHGPQRCHFGCLRPASNALGSSLLTSALAWCGSAVEAADLALGAARTTAPVLGPVPLPASNQWRLSPCNHRPYPCCGHQALLEITF